MKTITAAKAKTHFVEFDQLSVSRLSSPRTIALLA